MTRNFKYTKREFSSLDEMLKLRNSAGHEFFKSWIDLEARKDKLLASGEVSRWEIDFKKHNLAPDDVLKNKKLAKGVMLPSQSESLKELQKVFGFLNVQMLEQSEFVGLKRAKRYVRALTEWMGENMVIFSEVS